MFNCQLICVVTLVLVVGAEFCSSGLVPWGKKSKPLAVYTDLNGVTIRYKPKELFDVLGFSLMEPHAEEVARILAATSDKGKPNTIANKYSVNDLLAMNKVYAKDFTPEMFNAKLALCESLSPEHVEKPASYSLQNLMDLGYYQKGEGNGVMDKEDRKPHVYMYHKNLYDYCIEAFNEYYHKLRQEMRVDEELDLKVWQIREEVNKFRRKHLFEYQLVRPGDTLHAHFIMKDFLKEKQPDEVEQIRTSCSELINKISFVAERELFKYKGVPLRYNYIYTYCKGFFYEGL